MPVVTKNKTRVLGVAMDEGRLRSACEQLVEAGLSAGVIPISRSTHADI